MMVGHCMSSLHLSNIIYQNVRPVALILCCRLNIRVSLKSFKNKLLSNLYARTIFVFPYYFLQNFNL